MNGSHIAIPSLLKVGKGTLKEIGNSIRQGGMDRAVIYFGNGLIDMFGSQVMESLKEAGVSVLEYRELDSIRIEDIVELAFGIDNKAQIIAGIGGGKVIDAAKYAACLRRLPFLSVPTSASSLARFLDREDWDRWSSWAAWETFSSCAMVVKYRSCAICRPRPSRANIADSDVEI